MMKRYILLATILFFTCGISAQESAHYNLSWEREGVICGAGAIVGVAGLVLSGNIKSPTLADINSLNRNDINRFDRGATNHWSASIASTSDVLAVALMAAPVSLLLSNKIQRDYQTISFMYGETLWFSYFTASVAKGAVQRVRPYAYNANAPMNKKLSSYTKESFFSSHTVGAFASMSFLSVVYNEYYPDSKYTPWIIAGGFAAASVVGVMRVEAGHHFPTDVITGAAIGTAFGYIIPALHKNNKGFGLAPSALNNSPAVSLFAIF
jgi:membrane-associated phospholipid phosphatase